MSKELTIELMFYFTFDGLIILGSHTYGDVIEKAKEYYTKYGEQHTYNIYTLNKYDFKEMFNMIDVFKKSGN